MVNFGNLFQRKSDMTVKEAWEILERARLHGLTGISTVNMHLTKRQAWDIFSNHLKNKPDDCLVNSNIAQNILKEFG